MVEQVRMYLIAKEVKKEMKLIRPAVSSAQAVKSSKILKSVPGNLK